MKKVTYEEWQKNPTPRMMWVWDDNLNSREKHNVIYILDLDDYEYPVITVTNNKKMTQLWKHCAEITVSCSYCRDNRLHNRYKTDEDSRLKIKEVEEC
jgi:hypothetical protein